MDAQADLSLRWAHTHFVGFVTSWFKYHSHRSQPAPNTERMNRNKIRYTKRKEKKEEKQSTIPAFFSSREVITRFNKDGNKAFITSCRFSSYVLNDSNLSKHHGRKTGFRFTYKMYIACSVCGMLAIPLCDFGTL